MTAKADILAARQKVQEASALIGEAVRILEAAGLGDTADELARERRMVSFHVEFLGTLHDAPAAPEDWPDATPGRMLRQAQGVEPLR